MVLFIDSSDREMVRLDLARDKTRVTHIFQTDHNLSEKLIPEIKKFLQKQKVKLNQIKKIEVMAGPGPFSRIRTAVATANALAYALQLKQKMVQPVYDRQPNITRSKNF
jgi:tRNA A37 threonylcarbamoyladenosine modification protein TsaB